jgi:hypothetical protein
VKPERLIRTVVVPEHLYRRAVAIALAYDRLDGVELGQTGCRWEMILWYLLTDDVRGEPTDIAAELHASINRGAKC